MVLKIAVVGGGPIGCYSAFLAAKEGFEVSVFEEDSEIGIPIQCTGLLTEDILEFDELKEILKKSKKNIISKAKIISDKEEVLFNLKKKNYIIDRSVFDKEISKLAKKAGAKILLNHKIEVINQNFVKGSVNGKEFSFKADKILVCDGGASKGFNLLNRKKREIWAGIQAEIKGKTKDYIEFYPSKGSFGWVVPTKSTNKIGLLARKNGFNEFKSFLKQRFGKEIKKIKLEGGTVPYFKPFARTQKGNILLIGDSAGQVKATTGGGIIQGLWASRYAIESIKKKKSYGVLWKKKLWLSLLLHLIMRRMLDNFSIKEYNDLIKLFSKPSVKKVLEENDREWPIKYLGLLILKEPKLIKFIKRLFF